MISITPVTHLSTTQQANGSEIVREEKFPSVRNKHKYGALSPTTRTLQATHNKIHYKIRHKLQHSRSYSDCFMTIKSLSGANGCHRVLYVTATGF